MVQMTQRVLVMMVACVFSAWSQRVTDRRAAEIRGGGGEGKCTIEVVVDDVAEVEIIGRNAAIRTISGSPASFRRFQCNQAMPFRPSGFRFKGIDGRGRQDMVQSAEGGGRAVIRIEDSKGGSEGYTFDIFWNGGGGYNSGGYNGGGGYDGGGFRPGGYYGGGYNNGGSYSHPSGWNDGWGRGGGWNNSSFNFQGGNRGSGSFIDRNGRMRRLDTVNVTINGQGFTTVAFQGEAGRAIFVGNVQDRMGRRVIVRASGQGANGEMEIEMGSHNTVHRIHFPEANLDWSY